jgi:hypothetical protein
MVAAMEETLTMAPPVHAVRGGHAACGITAAQHGPDHVDREQALKRRLLEIRNAGLGPAVDARRVDQRA